MIPLMKNAFLKEHQTKNELAQFIMQASKLSMDVKCLEFEKKFATYHGRQHAILVNSGASANLLLLQALKNLGRLQDGDAVGFSAVTWSTNVMPIIQMGLEAVPVDCDPSTINVMSWNLEDSLKTSNLKALFITNALGFTGDLDKIKKICKAKNILLLEDNCESLGTELPSGRAGNFGLASTCSFFVAHHMSTIEGGMLLTDDADLAEMLKISRANGWDRNLTAEQQRKWRTKYGVKSEFEAKYTFYDLGFNVRPTEITGFLGICQLQYLEENVKTRMKNFLFLDKVLRKNEDLLPLKHDHISVLSNFSFPVMAKTPELRDVYLKNFSGAGIEIRPMIAGNLQNQPFYRKYITKSYKMPGADKIDTCGFYCGNYPELTENDLEVISSSLSRYQ